LPETYNEDMVNHLREEAIGIDERINAVYKISQHGNDYTSSARMRLLALAKTFNYHTDPCEVCESYLGNSKPE
jgi:hypothetical protein